jgi:hypothetical protein
MCSWILVWASGCHCQTICFFFWICQTIWLSRNELVAKANNSSWGVKVASAFDWGDEIKCFNPCYIRCWLISSMMKIPNTREITFFLRNTWEITIIRPHLLLRCGPGPTTTFKSFFTRPKRGAIFATPLCHISRKSTTVGSLADGSDHHRYYSCGTHNMFRWGPRAGPMWIHEIFVWDPHQVGPTHFICGTHNLKFMLSHSVRGKDLNNYF